MTVSTKCSVSRIRRSEPDVRFGLLRTANRSLFRCLLGIAGILNLCLFSGCAHLGVEPWERDILSEPDMQFDADPVLLGLDDHTYFSKEASSGGRAFGGGGCGCN